MISLEQGFILGFWISVPICFYVVIYKQKILSTVEMLRCFEPIKIGLQKRNNMKRISAEWLESLTVLNLKNN